MRLPKSPKKFIPASLIAPIVSTATAIIIIIIIIIIIRRLYLQTFWVMTLSEGEDALMSRVNWWP